MRRCGPQEEPGAHKLASLRPPGKNPGSHQHGRTSRILFLTRKQHLPTTTCWVNPDLARVPSLGQGIIVDSLRDMPIPSKTNTQNARQSYFSASHACVAGLLGASRLCQWPPCVAWDCRASWGTCTLHGTHSHLSALSGGHALHWHGPH